jgi:hypothetical protein
MCGTLITLTHIIRPSRVPEEWNKERGPKRAVYTEGRAGAGGGGGSGKDRGGVATSPRRSPSLQRTSLVNPSWDHDLPAARY